MTRTLAAACLLLSALALSACDRADTDAPPSLHLDDDICAECGMIISDERFASAAITEDDAGRATTLLFDDLNCMASHEVMNPELRIRRRWVHDHSTRAWIDANGATYLCSPNLQTPMASHVAAFDKRQGADALHKALDGDIRTFDTIWASLSLNGGCLEHPAP